jgi:hypothetical protein
VRSRCRRVRFAHRVGVRKIQTDAHTNITSMVIKILFISVCHLVKCVCLQRNTNERTIKNKNRFFGNGIESYLVDTNITDTVMQRSTPSRRFCRHRSMAPYSPAEPRRPLQYIRCGSTVVSSRCPHDAPPVRFFTLATATTQPSGTPHPRRQSGTTKACSTPSWFTAATRTS